MTSIPMNVQFDEAPALLGKERFVQRFGGVYEHSPWVAERCWQKGIDLSHTSVATLAGAMARVLAEASSAEQRKVILAHPDLAGKAALQGELTEDSSTEQSSAGLDQCTGEELASFQQFNAAYKTRFHMPFIMAVRGSNRHQILAGFEERLKNEPATEFQRALQEINLIAALRLQALAQSGASAQVPSPGSSGSTSSAPSATTATTTAATTTAAAAAAAAAAYSRDMIGYGNQPPQADWPGGARLAVQFVINYEEGGENCILHGDKASEAFLSEMIGAQPLPGVRHMNMESIYEYGSRVGFWRLHRLFSERRLPVTVFGVAMALERNPDAVAAMLSAGWEIASHGYRWIDYQFMDEAMERDHLQQAIAIHTRVTGTRPTGWYLGRCSPNSHRLVAEEGGFAYNADSYADDLPYWDTSHGERPQLIVPYTLDANDMRFASPQGFNAGDQFFNYLKDSFDVLYEEGRDTPRMMSIGLHCRLVGRPGRIASLARFLDYIQGFEDAWVARRIDIAEHWHRQHQPAG